MLCLPIWVAKYENMLWRHPGTPLCNVKYMNTKTKTNSPIALPNTIKCPPPRRPVLACEGQSAWSVFIILVKSIENVFGSVTDLLKIFTALKSSSYRPFLSVHCMYDTTSCVHCLGDIFSASHVASNSAGQGVQQRRILHQTAAWCHLRRRGPLRVPGRLQTVVALAVLARLSSGRGVCGRRQLPGERTEEAASQPSGPFVGGGHAISQEAPGTLGCGTLTHCVKCIPRKVRSHCFDHEKFNVGYYF